MKFLPLACCLPILAIHAEVPYVFKANDPARSTEVNQNFRYLDSAVGTKASKASVEMAAELVNTKASRTDLENRLEVGTFTNFQKKVAADSAMLEGKIKATASATQVKADLDAIRADVATKATSADLAKTSAGVAALEKMVAEKALAADLSKLGDQIKAKADTTALKTVRSELAALQTTVGTKSSATDLKTVQSQVSAMETTLAKKVNDSDLTPFVRHETMEGETQSFNKPPFGSSFATIYASEGAPFSTTTKVWYNLLSLRHRNGQGDGDVYGGQIAWGMTGFQGRLAFRTHGGTAWTPWMEVLTKSALTAENLPGGPYIKESTALSVDTAGVVHVAALQVHTDLATPDYVFAPDYRLSSLAEVEAFTKENQHLPDVPSAAEIGKGGLDLAKMNLALLRKVEELTLHAIAQEKRIQALETEMRTLR